MLIHRLDEPKLTQPVSRLIKLPFAIPPAMRMRFRRRPGTAQIGDLHVNVIFTPGHAPGHVMYHLPEQKILVGGDLIIGGAVGRTDLPDSDPAALEKSIRLVMKLPKIPGFFPVTGMSARSRTKRRAIRTSKRQGVGPMIRCKTNSPGHARG